MLDEAQMELWGAHWRRTFAAVGGFREAEEWKPTGNDFTPTPYSMTPNGLPSPAASDHRNDHPRPHEPHPWGQNRTNVGLSTTGAELVKRLEAIEREQERKKRKRYKETGTDSGASDYDLDCIMSDVSSEWSRSTTPEILDSNLTQDERSLVASLLEGSRSVPSPQWIDTPIEENPGTSEQHSNLSGDGWQYSRDSTLPAVPGSPVSEPTEAQRAALESLLNGSQSESLDKSSNTSTQESTKTLKRKPDSPPSTRLKKRRTCAPDEKAPLGEAAGCTASSTALGAPASNLIGILAKHAGIEARKRSKIPSKSKRKQTLESGASRSQISSGNGPIEQTRREPANEVMVTPNGKSPAEIVSERSLPPLQIIEESCPGSKTELLSPLEDPNPDLTNRDSSVDVVGHGLKEALPEVSTDKSKQQEEGKTGRSSQGPLYRDTVDSRESPKASRHGREKQKQTVQVVIYQPYARPGRSKGQSPKTNTPKKIQKSQQQNFPARSTRSKTDPDTPFVALNQNGKQSFVDQALEEKKAEEEAELQRKVDARYWRWHKKQKQDKKNMQRVYREWFDEQDDEFERQQAARGEVVSNFRFYGGYVEGAR